MTQVTGTVTATHLTYGGWEYLPNGNFESGFTSWASAYSGTATITTATDAHAGSYSISCISGDEDYTSLTYAGFTNTTGTGLQFYYKAPQLSDALIKTVVTDGDTVVLDDITTATDEWTLFEIDISDLSLSASQSVVIYTIPNAGGYIECFIDDVKINSALTVATIEDSLKTWTADQFNTDGMFILKSGAVQGFSCTILDTFENYIQVPTTFANIINNIETGTTYYAATEQLTNYGFETGDYTGWEIDDFATTSENAFSTGGITSATKYTGSYGFWYDAWCDGYPDWTGFVLSATITDITEIMKITYWYNIPNIQGGGELGTYFKVRAATAGDGEGNFVVVENYHTSVTDGWVQGELDVGTLTGEANLSFSPNVTFLNW